MGRRLFNNLFFLLKSVAEVRNGENLCGLINACKVLRIEKPFYSCSIIPAMKRILLTLFIFNFIFPCFLFADSPPPLPVVLVTFTATANPDNTITVRWSTQQEINSNNFTVERSADGSTWSDVGVVQAKGFSNQVSDYSFTDLSALDGITYYRLRIMNLDGDTGYTETRIVRLSFARNFIVFPNPAKDNLNIYLREASSVQMTLRLITVTGQIVLERKIEGGKGTAISVSLQKYLQGIYFVQLSGSDGTKQTSEIFITK